MTGASLAARISRAACLGAFVGIASAPTFAMEAASDIKPDDCLASPRGAAPKGERWYYRVDRATKHHCWYSRSGVAPKVATQKPQPPQRAKPDLVSEQASEPLLSSVANARAEADLSAEPLPRAEPAPLDVSATNAASSPSRSLADRWPDSASAGQPLQLKAIVTPAPAPAPTPQALPADPDDPRWALLIIVGLGSVLIGLATPSLVTFLSERKPKRSSQRDDAGSLRDEDEGFEMPWRDAQIQWVRPTRQPEQRDALPPRVQSWPGRRTT